MTANRLPDVRQFGMFWLWFVRTRRIAIPSSTAGGRKHGTAPRNRTQKQHHRSKCMEAPRHIPGSEILPPIKTIRPQDVSDKSRNRRTQNTHDNGCTAGTRLLRVDVAGTDGRSALDGPEITLQMRRLIIVNAYCYYHHFHYYEYYISSTILY